MNNDRFKFRVYDAFHNRYIPIMKDETTGAEGFAAFYSQYNNLCKPMSFFLCHQDNSNGHDRYIIEQCTGLKDKNGNLIYEGDIVGFHIFLPNGEWDSGTGTIVWNKSGWCILSFGTVIPIDTPPHIEIIGNVHTEEQK